MSFAGGSSGVPSFTENYEAQARQYVARIARQSGYRPAYGEREIAAAIEKDRFCREFCVREYKWSAHNLARFVNRTGEGPERIKEMKGIIAGLCGGLDGPRWCKTLSHGGAFDHGDFWGRDGAPIMMVGSPDTINEWEQIQLEALAQFSSLRVAVDDRPSIYGSGTHHVRIALAVV
jgi:hypothetical protein